MYIAYVCDIFILYRMCIACTIGNTYCRVQYFCGCFQVVHFYDAKVTYDAWELPRTEIEIGAQIGQGNYGAVFKGQLKLTAMSPMIYAHKQEMDFEGTSHLTVAVKMLRSEY